MTDSVSQPLSVNTALGPHGQEMFHLGTRFSDVQIIGYGGCGVVLSATDRKTSEKVAVKKLSFSGRAAARRALREIRTLKRLKHENIMQVKDIVGVSGTTLDATTPGDRTSSTINDLKHICIVEELHDADLHQLIRSNLLNPSYAKHFLYQLLCGLKYMHSANVIHRDLKPSNILIDCQQLLLKISDFGLCRVLDPAYDHSGYLTERVGTCWYVSPEQVLTPRDYTRAVDMWAAGCVFAEMLLGRPVFTGANELSQMLVILDSIHLTEEDWGDVMRVMPNKLLKNHPLRPRTPLAERFTDIDPQALDLLERLLTFDPAQRISAHEALRHPYLAEYLQKEPRARAPLSVEHEVEPTSPRSLERMLLTEASDDTTLSCGQMFSPAESICSSPRDAPDIMTSSSGSVTSLCSDDVQNETHTLEQILQLDVEQFEISPSGSICSSSNSNSVEDLNARNLRNSRENLMSPQDNILSLSRETLVETTNGNENTQDTDKNARNVSKHYACEKKRAKHHSDDEKDIAEPSLQKIEEDQELAEVIESKPEVSDNGDESASGKEQLFVQIDSHQINSQSAIDSENFKEFSQVSPKNIGSNNVTSGTQLNDTGARSKNSVPTRNQNTDYDEEYAKEKKLLEFESARFSKTEAEVLENEKNNKKRGARNNPASDLDERYRLPTDHLRLDRDYSNERIKHKKLTKVQRQYFAMYRDGLNELNERLREANIDGAVGGAECDDAHAQQHGVGARPRTQQNSITVSNIELPLDSAPRTISTSPTNIDYEASQLILNNRHRGLDLVNHQRVAVTSIQRQRNNGDGFSSPEDHPSSPRASFSSGARPKKSPRKQKAL